MQELAGARLSQKLFHSVSPLMWMLVDQSSVQSRTPHEDYLMSRTSCKVQLLADQRLAQ